MERLSLHEAAKRLLFSSTFIGVDADDMEDFAELQLHGTNWHGKEEEVIAAMRKREVIDDVAKSFSSFASELACSKYGVRPKFPEEDIKQVLMERVRPND